MKKLSFSLLGLALVAGSIFGMSSCGKFLDENADGHYVDGNTPYKISRFLTYAYPLSSLAHISELSSDNTYEDETRNPYREDSRTSLSTGSLSRRRTVPPTTMGRSSCGSPTTTLSLRRTKC